MTKILLLGDTHGNYNWVHYAIKYAKGRNCDKIVQLGDFGFGFPDKKGQNMEKFTDDVEASLRRRDINLYWIPGNHDNHTLLDEYMADASRITPEGFCKITEHIFYVPRGLSWVWTGTKFLGLGGAYSVDKDPDPTYIWPNGKRGWPGRTDGVNWWPGETITRDQAELAKKAGKVDILLTHDVPWGVEIPRNFKDDLLTEFNRKLLDEVVKATLPEYIFCGHYHMRFQFMYEFPYADERDSLAWHRSVVNILHRDNNPGKAWMEVELKEPSA